MKQSTGRFGVHYLAVIAGVVGYFFHATFQSGGSRMPLIVFSVLVSLLFLLSAAALRKDAAYEAVFRASKPDAVLSVAGALAIGTAGGMMISGSVFQKILAVLGILGGIGTAAAANSRVRGAKPQPFWMIFPTLFYVATLFYNFRHWMVDPAIIDYAFSLFVLICFMIASYQAAAFCFDRGSRRQLQFFALGGVFFGLTAAAGGSIAEMLLYLGGALTMLALARQAGTKVE